MISAVLVDAFIAPPAPHSVHDAGARPITVSVYRSSSTLTWFAAPPTQTLKDLECQVAIPPGSAYPYGGTRACQAADIAVAYPSLGQRNDTIYFPWAGCTLHNGHPNEWQGYNIEYRPATRAVVLHCYRTTPLVYVEFPGTMGIGPLPNYALLAISIKGIGPGSFEIHEDDRLEHLVGDTATETILAVTTIS